LRTDRIFDAIVVQRSRGYVKESQRQQNASEALFPEREAPRVVAYNLKATYGKLLTAVEQAFNKKRPLFVLGIYYPLAYWKGDKADQQLSSFDEGRQKQVVTLIRTLFLKRFESSARAFEGSCWRLLQKLLAWVTIHSHTDHDKRRLERWKINHGALINYSQSHNHELWPDEADEDQVEEFLTEDHLAAVEQLDPDLYKIDEIIDDSYDDLNQLAEFLNLLGEAKPERDDKLKALIKLLKNDPVMKKEKLILFTEFADTARYLEQQLTQAGLTGICRIDGGSSQKIRVLIATDVLSEGLNLQDATRIINYDLHWNPVRLMQRIGRVDRRMDPEIEARIVADHPDQKMLRGETAYWNFLPPEELDELLRLFRTVSKKTLRISKTFGIEGRKLLTPEDDYQALKEFTDAYEGTLSPVEAMHLELQALLREHPDLEARLRSLPGKVFSGKQHAQPGSRAVFFCYALPARPVSEASPDDQAAWTLEAGYVQWYLLDLGDGSIREEAPQIADVVRSTPDTPRRCEIAPATLKQAREKIEKHIKNTYLKKVQAPLGVEPVLRAWMEIN
jgi:hypothetical protein